MNLKKILTLFLITIIAFSFGFEVYAETYEYGYYYSEVDDTGIIDPTKGYWNPANQDSVKTNGTWYDAKLVFTIEDGKVMFNKTKYEDTYNITVKDLGNGKYDISSEGKLSEPYIQKYVQESGQKGWWNDFINFITGYGVELFDSFVEIGQIIDMSYLNKYYNDYKKMPEVIVACEYVTDKYSLKNWIENFSLTENHELIVLKDTLIFYYDDFNAPETFDISNPFEVLIHGFKADGVACYYYAQTKDANLNVCYSFQDGIENLKRIANNYTCDSKKFENTYKDMETKCENYLTKSGVAIKTTDGTVVARNCSESCRGLANRKAEICGGYVDGYRCGAIGVQLAAWLMKILKIIRYIVPVIIIILSTLDFIGAIASSNDDAMKKASQKLTKRIIAAIILFLLPLILQFLFDVFKIQGLESGNPFCVK